MVAIKISQADWCDEDCKHPAEHHGHELYKQHEKSIHEEYVLAHDKVHDALVHEPRVWIQKRANHHHENHADLKRVLSLTNHDVNEHREGEPENKLTEVVLRRQAAKGFCDYWMHEILLLKVL
jgi:hypothetical protein